MRRILLSFTFLIALFCMTTSAVAEQKSAVESVQDFYKQYLDYDFKNTPDIPRPAIRLSKAFAATVAKSEAYCRKYGEGPCGWAADGDAYLDTQEFDPQLSYSNSRISIKEIAPGRVQVKLNVYPSLEKAGDYYDRTITYKMVAEDGRYAVDDIAYTDGISTRKRLVEERKRLLASRRANAAGGRR